MTHLLLRDRFQRRLEWLLGFVSFNIIWWVDSHLNHVRYPNSSTVCVSKWFCDYADWRCFVDTPDFPEEAEG